MSSKLGPPAGQPPAGFSTAQLLGTQEIQLAESSVCHGVLLYQLHPQAQKLLHVLPVQGLICAVASMVFFFSRLVGFIRKIVGLAVNPCVRTVVTHTTSFMSCDERDCEFEGF